jgi:hypothetical protein
MPVLSHLVATEALVLPQAMLLMVVALSDEP